jgi:hypothetical protein
MNSGELDIMSLETSQDDMDRALQARRLGNWLLRMAQTFCFCPAKKR